MTGKAATHQLPVPLGNLFPHPGPDTNTEKFDVQVDETTGSGRAPGNEASPDDSGFGFYIMSGPPSEITSLHKRDGSHWELFGCSNDMGESRQTVKAVCTNNNKASNCGDIFKNGVPLTVLEMPQDCGPGKYAVAVNMRSSNQTRELRKHLSKRGLQDASTYDLTFDYDFSPIQRRGSSNVLLRIDYSDDPGYWQSIVVSRQSRPETKRKISTFDTSEHKMILEDMWHMEKRSMPLHELHKRWWADSGHVREWIDRQKKVDVTWTGIRHKLQETFVVNIFDEDLKCPALGSDWLDELHFRSWADLSVNLEVAAGVTLIGNLSDLSSFEQSHAWFKSLGRFDANLHFQAKGSMSFHTGPVELFGLENFGVTFRLPGIVTIGPNFRVLADLSGGATLQIDASYGISCPVFDYEMAYPAPSPSDEKPDGSNQEPLENSPVHKASWDLDAHGQLTLHVYDHAPDLIHSLDFANLDANRTPQIEFGSKFDSNQLGNAALNLGLDAYARIHANAQFGSNQQLKYCYGMDGGAELFGKVEAPKLLGTDLHRYYVLAGNDFVILEQTCNI